MAYPFDRLHQAALRELTKDRRADLELRGFGARGERHCCDGKCLQRHGICPAERKPLNLAPGVLHRLPARRARVSIGTKLIGIALAAAVLGTVFGPGLVR